MNKWINIFFIVLFTLFTTIPVSAEQLSEDQIQAAVMNWVVSTYYGGDNVAASKDVNFPKYYLDAYPVVLNTLNNSIQELNKSYESEQLANDNGVCVLRPPAVGGALSSGRGAVIERSAGGDHRPIISYIYLSSFRFIITV